MTKPVYYTHRIEFDTTVEGDHGMHMKIAEEVANEMRILAPLLVEQRMLKLRMEDLDAKIREVRGA